MRALALTIALTAATPALAQGLGTECRADAQAFEALQTGMTYAQAVALIGCEGVVMSATEFTGLVTRMLGWDGNGMLGSSMNAMFQNDALVMKSQFGLR
jgi:hypothetical protein